MEQKIDAIYENGLLRPLQPLQLGDSERVRLTVESGAADHWLDLDAVAWAQLEGEPGITLEEVRGCLAKFSGSLSDVVIAERGEY